MCHTKNSPDYHIVFSVFENICFSVKNSFFNKFFAAMVAFVGLILARGYSSMQLLSIVFLCVFYVFYSKILKPFYDKFKNNEKSIFDFPITEHINLIFQNALKYNWPRLRVHAKPWKPLRFSKSDDIRRWMRRTENPWKKTPARQLQNMCSNWARRNMQGGPA